MIWINLHNNRRIDLEQIEDYEFTIDDFAHPLSLINRYTGHTRIPYPVSDHSRFLSHAPQVKAEGLERAAILHDFSEALVNDISTPLKRMLPNYVALEERIQRHIFNVFDEPWENIQRLHPYDRRICADEMAQLFKVPVFIDLEPLGVRIEPVTWNVSSLLLRRRADQLGIK